MHITATRVRHGAAPAYFLGRPTAVYIDRFTLRGRKRNASTRPATSGV
jgi:hypothetical protein